MRAISEVFCDPDGEVWTSDFVSELHWLQVKSMGRMIDGYSNLFGFATGLACWVSVLCTLLCSSCRSSGIVHMTRGTLEELLSSRPRHGRVLKMCARFTSIQTEKSLLYADGKHLQRQEENFPFPANLPPGKFLFLKMAVLCASSSSSYVKYLILNSPYLEQRHSLSASYLQLCLNLLLTKHLSRSYSSSCPSFDAVARSSDPHPGRPG